MLKSRVTRQTLVLRLTIWRCLNAVLTLLLMWVHVQRIPKASTSPPRPIMLALGLTLLALSLLQPVTSQIGIFGERDQLTNLQLQSRQISIGAGRCDERVGVGVGEAMDGRHHRDAGTGDAQACLAQQRLDRTFGGHASTLPLFLE